MLKNILVPLDGSRLAEAALPAAAYLAVRAGAGVTLVHVMEQSAPQTIHGERHLTAVGEAESYLAQAAREAFPANVRVTCHVHVAATTDVVRSLVEHGQDMAPDLIVMCTHGHGRLRGLLLGSIAQRVVAAGRVPVLLIRPRRGNEHPDFACGRMLVPFDGTPEHVRGIEMAAELARVCAGALHLVLVVPTAGTVSARQASASRLMPAAARLMLELASEQAKGPLQEWVERLQRQGLTVSGEVRRGRPARVIANLAESAHDDLIVLGTHGRAGAEAFWADSTAAQVLKRSKRPLLLVPVTGD